MKCVASKSGKPLAGMAGPDPLVYLKNTQFKDKYELHPYVAAALAELMDGTVSHMEEKKPKGFYFVTNNNIATFIKFSDINYFDLINKNKSIQININTESKNGYFVSNCEVKGACNTFSYKYQSNIRREAELVCFLVSCLEAKRAGEGFGLTGGDFGTKLNRIIPQESKKSTGLLRGMLGVLKRRRR